MQVSDECYLSLARASLEEGDYAECLALLSRCRVTSSHRNTLAGEAHYAMARSLSAEGKWASAKDHFAQAASLVANGATRILCQRRAQLIGQVMRRVGLPANSVFESAMRHFRSQEAIPEELPPLAGLYSVGPYYSRWTQRHYLHEPSQLVYKMKLGDQDLARAFGYLAAAFLRGTTDILELLDFLAPVPTDPQRRMARGYGVPETLTKCMEEELAIPSITALELTGSAPELRGLSWTERKAAVRGLYAVKDRQLVGRCVVAIVDDVTTSGSTLKECARVLLDSGAWAVYGVVIARTSR